jgi:phage gp46-like protein
MTDIQTGWNLGTCNADWIFLPGNDQADPTNLLSYGNDLATAVIISIFTDAQADPSDVIPDNTTDPRGWWGGEIGSRVWLHARGKATPDLPGVVQQDVSDCLQWMIDDGVATGIDVAAAYTGAGQMVLQVTVRRGNGASLSLQFSNLWDSL